MYVFDNFFVVFKFDLEETISKRPFIFPKLKA